MTPVDANRSDDGVPTIRMMWDVFAGSLGTRLLGDGVLIEVVVGVSYTRSRMVGHAG